MQGPLIKVLLRVMLQILLSWIFLLFGSVKPMNIA